MHENSINQTHKKKWGDSNNPKKVRSSNFELFRILTMISIVAHHYVVNSGLMAADGVIYFNPTSLHSIVLLLVGAWGKIGINSFVLITGYFMCKSNITLNKFLKLLLEIMFYRIVIYAVFLLTGNIKFSVVTVIKLLIPVSIIADGFTNAFIVFFLFIPFLNILVKNINERQHIRLLILTGFLYIFLGTIPVGFNVVFNYVSWFIVLYFISSYISLYPKALFEKTAVWGALLIMTTLTAAASVIICSIFTSDAYMFVTDSNTFLAVLVAVCAFLFFKNLKIKNSKFINVIASATFGVFLIHTNSALRSWLWNDLLDVVGVHSQANGYLHIVLSVLGIYVVCSIIDLIRIYSIEKPFFKLWDKLTINLNVKYKDLENKMCDKLHIQ